MPADLGRTVVSIGNFDGVHLGHAHVLREAHEVASRLGIDTVVAVTFDPHPMAVLRPEHAPPTLTSIRTRARLLESAGVDAMLVLGFDRVISRWSPEEFIDRILVDALHAGAVVVGGNFRFGAKAAGEVSTLVEAGITRDFETVGVALDGGPQVWSSTYVRQCLATGDVSGASQALGRAFTVPGTVVEGDKRGSTPGSASRQRSRSAPTRPSTASVSVAWSPTCSIATTWSSTASRSRSRSSSDCAAW